MSLLNFGNAIAGIESGGRYDALGPQTKGDRAYGKYQVMGSNIGPWTEKFYGRRLTPDEFLASPEAQDAVFQGQFGGYVQKYGPEGAAKAWFAGEKGMKNPNAKDVLGTSVADYGAKFMGRLSPDAVMQQPMGILPPQPTQGILAPAQQMPMRGQPSAPIPEVDEPDPPRMMPLQAFRPKITKLAQAPRGAFSLRG